MENQGSGSWIHRRRIKSGGKTALIIDDHEVTYARLAERIDRLADAFRQWGIGRGDRVAYLGENHPSFLETFFAAGTLGAAFVPLNTRLAPPEVQFALQDSGASALVYSQELAPLAGSGAKGTAVVHAAVVRPDAAGPTSGDGGTSAGPGSEATAATSGGDGVEGAVDFAALLTEGSPEHLDLPVTHDDPAMILYTSGTTGKPKGAILTHGNLVWNCMNALVDFDLRSTDVALMISPMFHVASLNMGVLPTLLKGATVVLEPRFKPGRALALIEKHRATYISGVPTTYQMIAEHPDWDKTDISSLEKLTCGGSAVPLRTLEAYERKGLPFTQCYGMTETSPGATVLPPEKTREKAGSAGMTQFFTDIRIVDPAGELVGPHAVGEIQISGPNVIREYWNRPDATADSFADDQWFRSGDMGYFDDEGFIYITDRMKDMIISGGENIYPVEIEQIILELEHVASAAVVGAADEKWGEVPIAVVTPVEGAALTAEDVQAHLDGRLARYKLPRQIVLADDLPRTASGKIRKADLRKQYGNV
ncbi:acyl-CoA synthetase [Arthrobacter castelli]|uniref:acyl-CoA synthetase n=1 Tax=Arthrobacter castelli TaxID=271431 RepID=UPI00047A82F1|nr:long-chain fatty acid--CoA ligase [Arthrobacter castelli]